MTRTAIVHDWLDTWRGGENVLAALVALYPDADLFSLVDFLTDDLRAHVLGKHARTSFLQNVPLARRHFRKLLPLFPRAIESLDVSGYDLVISSSHAVAKGVRTSKRQLHLCYCHTPMRYAWDLRGQYLEATGLDHGLRGRVVAHMLDRLRAWDRASSVRVDAFAANSAFIRERIQRCYGRDATVVYPPVDVDFFTPATPPLPRDERPAYFTASSWTPYKRLDLIVEAFRAMPARRLIVGGDIAPGMRAALRLPPNIELVGPLSRERLREQMHSARAFVFAALEDFGITPVEAQACGTPVIAFAEGGTGETVRGLEYPRPTGVLFAEQTSRGIVTAIERFEESAERIGSAACRDNALRFGAAAFRENFLRFAASADSVWAHRQRP